MQCTFIVLSNELLEKNVGNEIASMIGDTNLFISQNKDVENDENILSAEVEIMVAEESQRGKKFGFNRILTEFFITGIAVSCRKAPDMQA